MVHKPIYVILFIIYLITQSFGQSYTVPDANIDAFHPKGFRVCIPDEDGIQIFAFHGSINKVLPHLAAGDYSRDIIRRQNGAWCFVDTEKKLKFGDVINYWTYVQLDGRGYEKNHQSFTVTQFVDDNTPISTGKHDITFVPVEPNVTYATFPQPPQIVNPENQCGSAIAELNINLVKLRQQIENLSKTNTQLLRELHFLEIQNSRKALVVTGINTTNHDLTHVLSELIIQKLALPATKFQITKADILTDGSIIFELKTRAEKNRILSRARARQRNLQNIKIEDIKAIQLDTSTEISEVEDEEFSLDVRAGDIADEK